MNTEESQEIYVPAGGVRLDTPNYETQIRMGVQGWPKSGKTFGAVSFPNPVVLSYDRGLVSHIGRKDIIEVPFYDNAFVNTICPKVSPEYVDLRTNTRKPRPSNRKDALIKWLNTEGLKLSPLQTLVVDGGTGIQAAYHVTYWTDPTLEKDGGVNFYAEYKQKVDYFTELMMCFKALRCNVVYIAHETADRDKKGELNGQLRPLLTGQFVDELASHFTDWFRQIAVAKPTADKMEDFKKFIGTSDSAVAKRYIDSTPANCSSIFLWQTQPDAVVKCGTSLVGAPKYVIANYKTFSEYQRKPTVNV